MGKNYFLLRTVLAKVSMCMYRISLPMAAGQSLRISVRRSIPPDMTVPPLWLPTDRLYISALTEEADKGNEIFSFRNLRDLRIPIGQCLLLFRRRSIPVITKCF